MHYKKQKSNKGIIIVIIVVILLALATAAYFLLRDKPATPPEISTSVSTTSSSTTEPAPSSTSQLPPSSSTTQPSTGIYTAIPLPEEMRAMWVSYLELEGMDLSSEAALRAGFGDIATNCKTWGLNTIIVIVRPFSDALYQSEIYPWSHIPTGTQGKDPGYDPLEVMIQEAHAQGLRLEAWINPYRVKLNAKKPGALASDNAALLHPEWATAVGEALWYDPGHPEVRAMLVDGVREIVQNYDIDGIHFDDYFYPAFPTKEENDAFDASTFAAYANGADRANWRRANVTALVGEAYRAAKEINNTVSFGISPAGNNDNNYNLYYCDVKQLIANEGFLDYIMPQLYWGFGWQDKNGGSDFALNNIAAQWAAYPRAPGVRLYAGLGTYRIGVLQADGTRKEVGDSQYGDQTMWATGHATTDMIKHLREIPGYSGFAIYRYAYLGIPSDTVSAEEARTLAELMAK